MVSKCVAPNQPNQAQLRTSSAETTTHANQTHCQNCRSLHVVMMAFGHRCQKLVHKFAAKKRPKTAIHIFLADLWQLSARFHGMLESIDLTETNMIFNVVEQLSTIALSLRQCIVSLNSVENATLNYFFINRGIKNYYLLATGFWDSSEAKPYDVSLYRIAVGSEKHDYYAVENRRFEIERISFDPGFNRNTGKYAADVALIILKTAINFKSYTTPVCVPWA